MAQWTSSRLYIWNLFLALFSLTLKTILLSHSCFLKMGLVILTETPELHTFVIKVCRQRGF